MTKRLPPHDPPTDDDLDAGALVRPVVSYEGEHRMARPGLAFAIGINLEPTEALLDLCAGMVDAAINEAKPKRIRGKRKRKP